jgi:putative membrane-bound dehydrogenase-like protein
MSVKWSGRRPEDSGSRQRTGRIAWIGNVALWFLGQGLMFGALAPRAVLAQEASTPHWIWHAGTAGERKTSLPAETCYFRKRFSIKEPSRLVLDATADKAFALYLDGKLVAKGADWGTPQRVEARLAVGPHVLAVRASNEARGPAGLLIRGGVLPLGQGVPVHTDATWRSSDRVPAGDGWTRLGFDDKEWSRARDLGLLGVAPWGPLALGHDPAERFRVPSGFKVQTVAAPTVTGSVVAFTFDASGSPCVSIERGPIARLVDEDGDGRYDRRVSITPQMENCQGLAFLKDHLYAVGHGPKGTGLYRLDDPDGDGVFDRTELIRDTNGGIGEHGPHAVALGPDGRLYYNNGNHAHLRPPIDPASPVNVAYEGELLPHYNDSRGHAAGIMAPGGEIFRSDDEGKTWKRVVAGFRNQYDFAFNRAGELFTFDSDMEWDAGLPWYRPVRVNHCPLGAEFGWRNGSAKWPTYYFDSLPATLDVGRGSPTGVTFYQAGQFPDDYHDRFLICDWSQGRILAVKLERTGASYKASADELVSGQPLNCTDIEAGSDGAVYFTTGGRGTQGGLYRVSWAGSRPRREDPGPFFSMVLDIDSPLASFSLKRIEDFRRRHAGQWEEALLHVARDPRREHTPAHRVRALEVLCQFGPEPGEDLLLELAADREPEVRSRAVALLGLHSSARVRDALALALDDADPFARRHACEALMQQSAGEVPVAKLARLLSDPDRFIRFAARVAIEHADLIAHRDVVLSLKDPRALVEGMLALVRATRLDSSIQDDLLRREIDLLVTLGDPDLERDLLRLIELTFLLGPQKAEALAAASLRPLLLRRFSTTADTPANREIARLLAFLDEPAAVPAILAHQSSVADRSAQIHDAYCLRAFRRGWTDATRKVLWAWYEAASRWEGGFSFSGYLDYMIQELVTGLHEKGRAEFLASGERYPFPTKVLVRELAIDGQPNHLAALTALYRRLLPSRQAGGQVDDLLSLILERLGRSPGTEAHAALRELAGIDPGCRDQLARALAGHPTKADLPVLVAALGSKDPNTSSLVAGALRKLEASPSGPEGLANLIRLARRMGPSSQSLLDELAARWTGEPRPDASVKFEDDLADWERVYRKTYPGAPGLVATDEAGGQAYDLPQLVENVLQGPVMKTASPGRGAEVLARARCLDCHKFGDKGAGLGPDLTTVSSRFRPGEILESVVLPSKVISDQYRSVTVATEDGKVYIGMPIVADGQNLVLLLPDGTKATVPMSEIEEQKASATSVMPEGLLNALSYQEIADLLSLFEAQPRVAAPEATAGKGR